MTEAEILYQISVNQQQAFSLMQWWLSVSVGVVALGHFFTQKLNLFLLILIISAYISYTVYVNRFMLLLFQQNSAFVDDLGVLQNQSAVSSASRVAIESMSEASAIFSAGGSILFASVVAFVGSISYLIYRYFSERKSRSKG